MVDSSIKPAYNNVLEMVQWCHTLEKEEDTTNYFSAFEANMTTYLVNRHQ